MKVVRRWRGWVAGIVVGGLVAGACGLEKHGSLYDDEAPAFSAERLGGDGSVAGEVLTPSEREALDRSRVSAPPSESGADGTSTVEGEALDEEEEEEEKEDKLDTAGKVGLSLLTVGLSLAAAAAPFLLF
jgi:hypothetical protein